MALWQLILTELRQFWREPGALFWTLVFPLGLVGALGLGFSNRRPPIYVIAASGNNLPTFFSDKETKEHAPLHAPHLMLKPVHRSAGLEMLKRGEALIFAEQDDTGKLLLHFDPDNAEARQAFLAFENAVLKQHAGALPAMQAIPVTTRGYRYIDFLVPGLLAMSIMNSCLWGIGWALVEYRVKKLLRRMAASPMRKSDFLLAQMITRLLLLAAELGTVIGFAYLFFDVRMQGSWTAFVLLVLAGTWTFSGLAFLLSSRTAKTAVANGMINAVTLPLTVVSGIFFSYRGFPEPLVAVIERLPLTLLADNLRGIFNEGYGTAQILFPAALLFGLGSVLFAVALRIYKWQ